MTTRLLQGVQRIETDRWQWGCWEITKHAESRFWIAVDGVTDFGPDPDANAVFSRVKISPTLRTDDLRYFVESLSRLGPEPLTVEQVRALEAAR